MEWFLPISVTVVTSAMTLSLTWVMMHRKAGLDKITTWQTDLGQARAEITRVSNENEECRKSMTELSESLRKEIKDLRDENFELMRKVQALLGGS